jgi:hypothetical protein
MDTGSLVSSTVKVRVLEQNDLQGSKGLHWDWDKPAC